MKILRKVIYSLGESLRNRYIRIKYSELKATEFYTIDKLHKIQEIKLRKILLFAKNHSAFYSEMLNESDIKNFTIEDLASLPILTKDLLLTNQKKIQVRNQFKKLIKSETSGSTGNPLVFFRNLEWDAATRAAQYRGYDQFDIKPWNRNLYFWGFNFSFISLIKTRVLDFLVNRYRVFSFDNNKLRLLNRKIKRCDYIEGYSSGIYKLAQFYNENNISFDNLKMIKGTSEKIYDSYNAASLKAFKKKIVSEYGAAETGIIAFECPLGNMHITMENVIVEEIGGKAVITNLESYSFPIIRYELGDYIILDKKTQCDCGRQHYVIKDVLGRVGKDILGNTKEYASLTLYYIFKNIALNKKIELAYFAKQYEKGKLTIEVIIPLNSNKHKQIKNIILNECDKYYADDLIVDVLFLSHLTQKGKKEKDFESFIK